MSKAKGGLGRGLGSLIPQKTMPISSPALKEIVEVSQVGVVMEISPEEIRANPHQPRKHFAKDELMALMGSIKEFGILQPLVVTQLSDGGYELIAGERRLRSAKELKMDTVPVIIRTATEQQKLEIALIENIQRENLNAIEEGIAYKALIEQFNLSQQEMAKRVSKSRPYVANTIRLLDLDEEMQQALVDGRMSRSHARTLLSEGDPMKRELLFQAIIAGGVTVREAEARSQTAPGRGAKIDPNIAALEAELREKLGTKVKIKMRGGKGAITIHYYSKEELKALMNKLS